MQGQYIGTYKYRELTGVETDPTKNEVLAGYDEYQINKLTFLNECYDIERSERTMISYWTLYNTNLHYDEVSKQKDLMYFTTEEIKRLIKSAFGMDTTKASLGSFLSMYYRWADKRGDIGINPYITIRTSAIKTNSKNTLAAKLYGQNLFYTLCAEMEKSTKLPNIIPFILARYGIAGERLYHMRYLRWDDIDEDNLKVYIRNKEDDIITVLDVDTEFIKWMHKAKNYTESTPQEIEQDGAYIKKKNIIRYEDYGYVLKKALDNSDNKTEEDKVNKYNTIYNRGNVACQSIGIKRISFKDLVRTRQLELLLQIRKERRLEMKDFEDIVDRFALDDSKIVTNKAFTLKKRYEELTGDTVIVERKELTLEHKEDSTEIANKIIESLGLKILY